MWRCKTWSKLLRITLLREPGRGNSMCFWSRLPMPSFKRSLRIGNCFPLYIPSMIEASYVQRSFWISWQRSCHDSENFDLLCKMIYQISRGMDFLRWYLPQFVYYLIEYKISLNNRWNICKSVRNVTNIR
jgi:hypothetical protein